MKRTSTADLAVVAASLAIIVYAFLRVAYESVPPVGYGIAVPLLVLAVAELVAARRVHGAVMHDPHAKPMAAIVIARCVALGKASALVAAGMIGACLGLLIRVGPDSGTVRAASGDLRVGIGVLVVSGLLLVAGLLLERAGVDPGRGNPQRPGPA
jgi:hypothetical protein